MSKNVRSYNPALLTAGYVLISLGFGILQVLVHIPDFFIFWMAVPLIWIAFTFPARYAYIALLGLDAAAIGVIHFLSDHFYASLSMIIVFSLALALIIFLIRRMEDHHRNLELQLENAEEQYRLIAEYAADMEFWRRPDGIFQFVSPNCERLTGYSQQEFLDNPDLYIDITLPEYKERVLKQLDRSIDEYSRPLEYQIRQKNGSTRWVELSTRQVYNEQGKYLGRRGSSRDIQSRKLMEEAFKTSNTRLRLAFEGTDDGIWDWELKTQNLDISPNYARNIGFRSNQIPGGFKTFLSKIHPDDQKIVETAIQEHTNGQTAAIHVEYRIQMAGGEWAWTLSRGKIIERDQAGDPARMIGIFTDITERKKVEESLLQSEQMFRQMAESMRELFWVADVKTRKMIYLSPAYQEIWGRPFENNENLSAEFFSQIHPADRERVIKTQIDAMKRNVSMKEEFRIMRSDESVRWVQMRGYPVASGDERPSRFTGICEDITERKLAEEALQHSEARYRELIEKQGEGVALLTQELTFLFTNPAADELFGIGPGKLIGRNLAEFIRYDKDLTKLSHEAWSMIEAGEESSFDVTIFCNNGSHKDILITTTPRYSPEGELIGAICIFHDITRRKREENELRYLSSHDTLTGLYNRAYFEQEVFHMEECGQLPISLIMVDVDRLKAVNDQSGHLAGDEILIRAARVLKLTLRKSDIVARIGGDEFAALLPETDEDMLQDIIYRIHENLALENENRPGQTDLSFSLGGATCKEKGTFRSVLADADAQMYYHKNQKNFHKN